MTYIISISLTDENKALIAKVENKSQLINKLLKDYFPKSIAADVEEELKILENQKSKIAEDENKIILKKREIQKIEEDEKAQAEQKKLKQFAKAEKLRAMFKEDLGRDITNEELDDYLELEMIGQTNYFKFMEELKK